MLQSERSPYKQEKNEAQEFLHKQTFDQSAAIAALSALAMSGNLDSGGGLTLFKGV